MRCPSSRSTTRSCRYATIWATRTASGSPPIFEPGPRAASERRAANGSVRRGGLQRDARVGAQLEFTRAQLDVGEVLDPVAEHEEHAAAVAALVDVVKVADHHGVEALGEPWRRDLAIEPIAVQPVQPAGVA